MKGKKLKEGTIVDARRFEELRYEAALKRQANNMLIYFYRIFLHESEIESQKWRHQKWLIEALVNDKEVMV